MKTPLEGTMSEFTKKNGGEWGEEEIRNVLLMNFIPPSFLSRIAFQLLISDYDTHFLFTNSRKNIGRCKTSLSLPILGKTINDKNALYNGRRKDSEEKNEFLLYYL